MKINLNDTVFVKLMDEGYEILNNYWHRYDYITANAADATKHINVDYLKSQADKDGYTKFQWHEFMGIFGGDNINTGQKPPFDLNVKIHPTPNQ